MKLYQAHFRKLDHLQIVRVSVTDLNLTSRCGVQMHTSSLKYFGPATGDFYLDLVGHGGSPTTEVRRVLFDVSFNVYHHSLGTPIGGHFSYVY